MTRSGCPAPAGGRGSASPSGRRAAAGVAALLLAFAPAVTGRSPAARAAACTGTSGVTVVVDYGSLGGTQVGCAAGDPASGLAALSGAGFGYAFVPGQPGLICTINGLPGPCNGPPPTNAYWSYWHAPAGGSWTYGSTGAGSYNPAPGTVEGWSFGAGSAPGIAPPFVPAPPPPPPAQPSASQPPASRPPAAPPAARPSGTATPGQPAPNAPGAAGASGAQPAATTPGTGGASPSVTAPTSGATTVDDDRPAAQPVANVDRSGGTGGTIGVLAAAALIAALAALAIWRSRVRRRSAEP